MKSNCLLGALVARWRLGGRFRWWPGWNNSWREWSQHPWGHFYVELPNGVSLHYDSPRRDLSCAEQLWFEGRFIRGWKPGRHSRPTEGVSTQSGVASSGFISRVGRV